MRFIGLDVDRDFCEVAIADGGRVRLAGRVQTEPAALALFAQSLSVEDEVALEATGNALGIARIIAPHVGRLVLANPKAVKGITQAGAKTDKIDARTLAKVLPADEQETVAACLRQIEFLDAEIALVERALAEQVLGSAEMRRLLTLPGVNFVTAAALIAAIGEIDRFATSRHLASY